MAFLHRRHVFPARAGADFRHAVHVVDHVVRRRDDVIRVRGNHLFFARAEPALLVVDAVIIGFLDENSVVRRLGYAREESRLRDEIEKYRKEYEENTERLNELAVDSGAIERIAREKYLMKKPNEDIYVFEEDIEE